MTAHRPTAAAAGLIVTTPASATSAPSSPRTTPPSPTILDGTFGGGTRSGGRDPFYDVLRAGALGRVVLWHTLAAAWISWAYAAMPSMFFVAGAMLARSAGHSSPTQLVRRRALRVLIPLWAYGAVVAASGAVRSVLDGTTVVWGRVAVAVLRWSVPITDPPGPAWQQGWLTSHLWYLRAYLWLVLAAPLLLAAARRWRWTLPALATGVVFAEWAWRVRLPLLGEGAGRVALGDLTCYGLFAVAGAAWASARPGRTGAIRRRRLLVGAAVAGPAAVAVAVLGGLPTRVANDSYPVLALLGAAWLAAALAGRGVLARVGASGPAVPLVSVMNRRAVTIYLWHPAAIAIAAALLPGSSTAVQLGRLGLTVVGTAAVVACFGWLEDVAAHRLRWPDVPRAALRRTRLAALVLAAVLPVVLAPGTGARRALPPPSDRAALTDADFVADIVAAPSHDELHVDPGRLQGAIDRWVADRHDIGGVEVAVEHGGAVWSGRALSEVTAADRALMAITDPDLNPDPDPDGGDPAPAGERFAALSITKLFTAALVVQLAVEGRVDLDAPMPPIAGVVPPPAPVTPRQLLQHTSGLENYPDVAAYDPDRLYRVAEAVSLSTGAPLRAAPGEAVWYSNSNFLWLGLLVEDVTGQQFDRAVQERLTIPLGLASTSVDLELRPGWAGHGSGSVVSTASDLVRFSSALFGSDDVVPLGWVQQLVDIDAHNVGLAAWPLCPCATVDGHKQATAIGHTNAYGGVYHYTADDVSIFVRADRPVLDPALLVGEVAVPVFDAMVSTTA